jgi:hypothetical protein
MSEAWVSEVTIARRLRRKSNVPVYQRREHSDALTRITHHGDTENTEKKEISFQFPVFSFLSAGVRK